MQRVLVLGSSGSGKSTFVNRLAKAIGLPIISLDAIYWKPGWQPSDPVSFGQRIKELALGDRWIMDGNYISQGAGDLRRDRADTILWFDLPRHVCMRGILSRIARTYGNVRPEMAAGCPERIDLEFFRYVWTYRARQRPKLLKYFEGLRSDQKLICFNGRAEADDFIANLSTVAADAP
jgi:adenylate kinase family enzyme